MTDPLITLQSALKDHGQSLTKPRQTVFDHLKKQDNISMHDLILACEPVIDRASVYRTVALFEQLGIVQRIHIGWKYRLELTDQFRDHHHHAICTKCSSIITLKENYLLEKYLRDLASGAGFEATSHQVEIRGFCENCKQGIQEA